MNHRDNRRRRFFANAFHRQLFFLVYLGAVVPMLLAVIGVYYVIFHILADEMVFPEAIISNVFPAAQKALAFFAVAVPVAALVILIIAYKVTHQIVGPFDRLVNELDLCARGPTSRRLSLRKGDKFWPLVNRINLVLDQWEKTAQPR